MDNGRELARCLGASGVALMRVHGFVSTGRPIYGVVRLSVLGPRNARVVATALRFGEVHGLSVG
jgi:predicted exporter